MKGDGKKYIIDTFLLRTLTKGIHAWLNNIPIPKILEKKHLVHKLVWEAYEDHHTIGWRCAIRVRINRK